MQATPCLMRHCSFNVVACVRMTALPVAVFKNLVYLLKGCLVLVLLSVILFSILDWTWILNHYLLVWHCMMARRKRR